MQYNAKPVLSGRIKDAPLGSIMRLAYRGPVMILPFYVFWYGFLTFVTVMLAVHGIDPADDPSGPVFAVAILIVMWLAPATMHVIGTRNADDELDALLEFLRDTVETQPVEDIIAK